jgi:hypothetical protein
VTVWLYLFERRRALADLRLQAQMIALALVGGKRGGGE